MDPAAASSTAALKGSETGGSAARGSVSKRWVGHVTAVVSNGYAGEKRKN